MKYRRPFKFNKSKENRVKFITYSFILNDYWYHFGICLPDYRFIFCKEDLKGLTIKVQKDYIEVEDDRYK